MPDIGACRKHTTALWCMARRAALVGCGLALMRNPVRAHLQRGCRGCGLQCSEQLGGGHVHAAGWRGSNGGARSGLLTTSRPGCTPWRGGASTLTAAYAGSITLGGEYSWVHDAVPLEDACHSDHEACVSQAHASVSIPDCTTLEDCDCPFSKATLTSRSYWGRSAACAGSVGGAEATSGPHRRRRHGRLKRPDEPRLIGFVAGVWVRQVAAQHERLPARQHAHALARAERRRRAWVRRAGRECVANQTCTTPLLSTMYLAQDLCSIKAQVSREAGCRGQWKSIRGKQIRSLVPNGVRLRHQCKLRTGVPRLQPHSHARHGSPPPLQLRQFHLSTHCTPHMRITPPALPHFAPSSTTKRTTGAARRVQPGRALAARLCARVRRVPICRTAAARRLVGRRRRHVSGHAHVQQRRRHGPRHRVRGVPARQQQRLPVRAGTYATSGISYPAATRLPAYGRPQIWCM